MPSCSFRPFWACTFLHKYCHEILAALEMQVAPGSPAEKAGLKSGDVITGKHWNSVQMRFLPAAHGIPEGSVRITQHCILPGEANYCLWWQSQSR